MHVVLPRRPRRRRGDEPDERRGASRACRTRGRRRRARAAGSRLSRTRRAGRAAAVDGYDAETAALDAGRAGARATAAIDAAGDLDAYGFFTSGVTELAVVSTNGVEASQRLTDATVLVLVSGEAVRLRDADRVGRRRARPARSAGEAAEKAARTSGAGELEPGIYRAVLEPYALAELLQYFAWDSLGGLGLLEERSYFSGRLGERVFDERSTSGTTRSTPRASQGIRLRGSAEGARRADRARRRARRRLGPPDGEARGRRVPRHGPRASCHAAGVRPTRARAVAGGRRGGVDRRPRRGGGRRHLHHAGPLPRRRPVARGRDHGHDARRHVPDPRGKIAEPLVNLRFTVASRTCSPTFPR